MRNFSFKFQTLLNLREQIEKQKQEEFGHAQRKLNIEKAKLFTLEKTKELLIEEYNVDSIEGTKVYKLIEKSVFLSQIQKEILEQEEKVNEEQNNVDKVREELLQAVKDRKILEKLKEKKYAEYVIESKIEEQKIVDQLVSYKVAVGETYG